MTVEGTRPVDVLVRHLENLDHVQRVEVRAVATPDEQDGRPRR